MQSHRQFTVSTFHAWLCLIANSVWYTKISVILLIEFTNNYCGKDYQIEKNMLFN